MRGTIRVQLITSHTVNMRYAVPPQGIIAEGPKSRWLWGFLVLQDKFLSNSLRLWIRDRGCRGDQVPREPGSRMGRNLQLVW